MPITTSAVELVVRPSDSGDGSEAGCDSDYEPSEVRRDPPLYSRSDRFSDDLTRLQNLNPSPNSNSRLRVGSLNSGSGGSVLIDCLKNKEGGVKEEENQENKNVDVGGVETSFGEIVLEFEVVRTYRELSSELRIEQKLIIIQIDEKSRGSVVEIIERNRAHSFSLKIDLGGVHWAVQALQQLGLSFRGGSFFSKYCSSSAVFCLQKYTNDKGVFVEMSKWEGGIKKGNIILPAGYNGRGWFQIAAMLRKVIGIDARANFKGMDVTAGFIEEKLSKNTKESFMDRKTGANRGRRCVGLFTANGLNSLKSDMERAVVCTRYDFSSSWVQIEKNLSKYLKINIALRPF
ncbi:hypothetical protein LOK49_LG08G00360 [Camellia lanceoleosa]|uniref:Uncharacterized protein n=1 Tax=Camellia lanceoleosa TaxID=1840588 RepID=A0ACC0GMQ1_9ERIC|nr:hypothetical protein LOK49_LG08G00360 [Camellia lanceoleosa]